MAGATAAVTAVTAFATKTASACDEIDKMSQKIGISRESYQELDFILSQNGMDVNQLQTGLKTLSTQMLAAQSGTKTSVEYFKELGVTVTDSSGALRSQEDVFYDTIAALQGMENETERNALAAKVFGKSATELYPLLNSGAGSMEELRQKAHDLGLVLEDEVIDSGVSLTDTMDQLKRSFEAIGVNLGGAIMPLVEKVAQFLIGEMPRIQAAVTMLEPIIVQLFDELVPPLMEIAESIFPVLVSLLVTLLPVFTQLVTTIAPVLVEVINGLLPPIIQIVSELLPPLLELLMPLLELLMPLLELMSPLIEACVTIITPLLTLINDVLTPLIAVVQKVIELAIIPLQLAFNFCGEQITNAVETAVAFIKNRFEVVRDVFQGFIDFFKAVFAGDWEAAWDAIRGIVTRIWDGIVSDIKLAVNFIINSINSFISGINGIKIPDWVPGVGGKGINIPLIPTLAEGGILAKGQIGLLEGNGAEAVVPLDNNRKWVSAVAADMKQQLGGVDSTGIADVLQDILPGILTEAFSKMQFDINGREFARMVKAV